jgi:hypothetical protein
VAEIGREVGQVLGNMRQARLNHVRCTSQKKIKQESSADMYRFSCLPTMRYTLDEASFSFSQSRIF